MIPRFNKNGYLPRGIHKATLNEVGKRFGTGSQQRKEIFKSVISVTRLLRKHKTDIKRFLLNGSYVTFKEAPEDFDCIVILREGFDFKSPEAKKLRRSKKLFNGHVLFVMEEDASESKQVIDFFGHDRDGKAKGIVEVKL